MYMFLPIQRPAKTILDQCQQKKKSNQHQHVPLNIAYSHVFSFKQILSVDNHLTGRPLPFFCT